MKDAYIYVKIYMSVFVLNKQFRREFMPINIKLENFEGPFDLLLHLIKKNQMEIYDIKIFDITEQYLEYLNSMKEMDLEITSEFIVIAATLLEIKSKLLLPQVKNEQEDEGEDPRKELISKLLEYKKYKQISEYMKQKEIEAGVVFTKKPEIIDDFNKEQTADFDILNNINMLDLYNLYAKLMEIYINKSNTENRFSREIPIDRYKIEDKMDYLLLNLNKKERLLFSNIREQCENKIEIVVTFLALLELIKLKNVKIVQQSNFREIYIERIYESEEV